MMEMLVNIPVKPGTGGRILSLAFAWPCCLRADSCGRKLYSSTPG